MFKFMSCILLFFSQLALIVAHPALLGLPINSSNLATSNHEEQSLTFPHSPIDARFSINVEGSSRFLFPNEKVILVSINKALAEVVGRSGSIAPRRFSYPSIGAVYIELFAEEPYRSVSVTWTTWGLYLLLKYLAEAGNMRETWVSLNFGGIKYGTLGIAEVTPRRLTGTARPLQVSSLSRDSEEHQTNDTQIEIGNSNKPELASTPNAPFFIEIELTGNDHISGATFHRLIGRLLLEMSQHDLEYRWFLGMGGREGWCAIQMVEIPYMRSRSPFLINRFAIGMIDQALNAAFEDRPFPQQLYPDFSVELFQHGATHDEKFGGLSIKGP